MEIKLLKDVCSISKGQQINGDDLLKKGDYKFFNGGINASGYWNEYNVKENSISISEGGNSCGYVNYQIEPFWCGAHCYYLYDLKVSSKYLYYYLKYRQSDLMAIRSGVCMPNIKKKDLENFKINLKSIDNQHDVINTLEKIESLIQINTKKLEKFDEIVKSQFIEMFGKCDNYDLIGNVLNICRGASPRPISNYITSNEDGVNWIKIGDVDENSLYITSTEERITKEGALKSRTVKPGDFILSNSMSFGRPYILGINGCVHDGWLILSDYENTFNPLYLYHAIRDDEVQYQFNGKANGATVRNLNSELVRNTSIKIPSINQQNKFADFVQQIDKSKYFGGVCYGIC